MLRHGRRVPVGRRRGCCHGTGRCGACRCFSSGRAWTCWSRLTPGRFPKSIPSPPWEAACRIPPSTIAQGCGAGEHRFTVEPSSGAWFRFREAQTENGFGARCGFSCHDAAGANRVVVGFTRRPLHRKVRPQVSPGRTSRRNCGARRERRSHRDLRRLRPRLSSQLTAQDFNLSSRRPDWQQFTLLHRVVLHDQGRTLANKPATRCLASRSFPHGSQRHFAVLGRLLSRRTPIATSQQGRGSGCRHVDRRCHGRRGARGRNDHADFQCNQTAQLLPGDARDRSERPLLHYVASASAYLSRIPALNASNRST